MTKEISDVLDSELNFKGKWNIKICLYALPGFDNGDCHNDNGEFTMSVKKLGNNEFTGTIKDKYGLSHVLGDLKDNKIKFTKTYSPEAIEKGAATLPIIYEGVLTDDGKYRGKLHFKDLEFEKFPFELEQIK